ncbi:helicase sen1 [Schizosaccharomyces japonicus yFS275]|uniref:Helicase sen1 n=1 Tax=Schizosaccharomyces japonicus (strain yFS275 / FY16936) TaxID=402676 RepID=B6K5E8_SCHJY|nr:helicase sen1 [Schizosaccharomyces japonicus yFS275]EEB08752.1 helicase sen1 [Schizosaccharomyces japonicus yFS275]
MGNEFSLDELKAAIRKNQENAGKESSPNSNKVIELALKFLDEKRKEPHWFCDRRLSIAVRECLYLFSFQVEKKVLSWLKVHMTNRLKSCPSCILAYYKLKQEFGNICIDVFHYTKESLSLVLKRIQDWDIERLVQLLKTSPKVDSTPNSKPILCAFYEILYSVELLQSPTLFDLFRVRFTESGFLRLSKKLVPGVVYLLFSEDVKLRKWAHGSFNSLEIVSSEEFMPLQGPFLQAMDQICDENSQSSLTVFYQALRTLLCHIHKDYFLSLQSSEHDVVQFFFTKRQPSTLGEFAAYLQCFQQLLKVFEKKIWTIYSQKSALKYLEDLLQSEIYTKWITEVSQPSDVVTFDGVFSWAKYFISSLPILNSLNAVLKLLEHFIELYKSCNDNGVNHSSLLESICECFQLLFNEFLKGAGNSNNLHEIDYSELQAVSTSTYDRFFDLLDFEHETSIDSEIVYSTFGFEIEDGCFWKHLKDVLKDERVTLASTLLSSVSEVALADELETKSGETDYAEQFHFMLDSFRTALGGILNSLQDWSLSSQSSLIKDIRTCRSLFSLSCSPIKDISSTSLFVLKTALDCDSVEDMLHKLLEDHFSEILSAFNTNLDDWTRIKTFRPARYLLRYAKIITDTFCNRCNGLIVVENKLRVIETNRRAMTTFWSNIWTVMASVFLRSLYWPAKHSRVLLIDFMRDTLECCLSLLDNLKDFEYFMKGEELSSSTPSSSSFEQTELSSKMISNLKEPLGTLCYWLKLNDEALLCNVVAIICKMLRACKRVELPMSLNVVSMIEKYANSSKDHRTILTKSEREDLLFALAPYLPEPATDDDVIMLPEVNTVIDDSILEDEKTAVKSPELDKHVPVIEVEDEQFQLPALPSVSPQLPSNTLKSDTKNKTNTFSISADIINNAKKLNERSVTYSAKRQPVVIERKPKPPASTFNLKKASASSTLKQLKQNFLQSRGPVTKFGSLPGRPNSVLNRKPPVASASTSSSDSSDSEGEKPSDGLFSLIKDVDTSTTKTVAPRRGIQLLDPSFSVAKGGSHPVQQRRTIQQSAQITKARLFPDVSKFYKTLLSWNPACDSEIPPTEAIAPCKRISATYTSVENYINTFEPLLFHELWAQMVRSKVDNNSPPVEVQLLSRSTVDAFIDLFVVAPDSTLGLGIGDSDVCAMSKSKNPSHPSAGEPAFLVKVQSITKKKSGLEVTLRTLPTVSAMQLFRPNLSFYVQKLFSITTNLREYSSLRALSFYDVSEDIIKARCNPCDLSLQPPQLKRVMESYHVNEPQALAIHAACARTGFTLVQGPPGTGKTKTILGIVSALLTSGGQGRRFDAPGQNGNTQPGTKKVLICAPSNAAIDEILLRLKDGIFDHEGIKFKPKILRVGYSESINPHVKEFTLDEKMQEQMQVLNLKKNQDNGESMQVRKRHDEILKERDALRAQLEKARNSGINDPAVEMKLREVMKTKNQLEQRLDDMRRQQGIANRNMDIAKKQIQSQLLKDAEIICSTLSASGHDILLKSGISFPSVIIDEAAQAVELSALIPLKYGCERCIMVGDPNQLPPTVLSKTASQNGYSESLYVRMHKQNPNSSFLLSIQYRMHPEISRFPSSYFYGSRLLDGPDMQKLTARPWHHDPTFGIYRFFDVRTRESSSITKSVYNPEEASFVLTLYDKLVQDYINVDMEGKVGIVTPYRRQLQELRMQFERRYGPLIFKRVDFNTVDGFQGQEKDIILFSCVRGDMGGGIGFLSDTRRLNVALTRAKSSLYIIGNVGTLTKDKMWSALITDAQTRSCLVTSSIDQLRRSQSYAIQSSQSIQTPKAIPSSAISSPISAPSPIPRSLSSASAPPKQYTQTNASPQANSSKLGSQKRPSIARKHSESKHEKKRKTSEEYSSRHGHKKRDKESHQDSPNRFLSPVSQTPATGASPTPLPSASGMHPARLQRLQEPQPIAPVAPPRKLKSKLALAALARGFTPNGRAEKPKPSGNT